MNNLEKNVVKLVAKTAPWLAPFPSAVKGKEMCDNCIDGLISRDNSHDPEHCEKCTIGLGLAMAYITGRIAILTETESARVARAKAEERKDNPFSLALRDESEKLVARWDVEHDRLNNLRLALSRD